MNYKSWMKKLLCAATASALALGCMAGCSDTDAEVTSTPDGGQVSAAPTGSSAPESVP